MKRLTGSCRSSPSFKGLASASDSRSALARASSKKSGTRCEKLLAHELRRRGLRFTRNVEELPGKPDFVFEKAHLVVFCDGDFWHGRDFERRRPKLRAGHNPTYWVAKIESNIARDRRVRRRLRREGWAVVRVWEGDVHKTLAAVAARIVRKLAAT